MPWAVDAEIKAALAAALKRKVEDLPAYVDDIVAASIDTAREQIRNATLPLGYTEAQLLDWSSLRGFHRHQSLYWAEVELREAFKDTEGVLHARKNRIAELVDAIQGVIVPDDPVDTGGVGSGTFAAREAFDAARARERAGTRLGSADWPYAR